MTPEIYLYIYVLLFLSLCTLNKDEEVLVVVDLIILKVINTLDDEIQFVHLRGIDCQNNIGSGT